MGLGDFFKNIFGKKTCAFCGGECGMLNRTKLKGDEFICSKCDDNCSAFIRKGRYTKSELEGHMEYIKRLDRIFNEVILPGTERRNFVPSTVSKQGFEFFDDFGMFRITDDSRDSSDRYPVELFRYDQVASWEPYLDEGEPDEEGGEKIFGECGIILTLAGATDDTLKLRNGVKAHPYITEEIKVCFTNNEREKEQMLMSMQHAVGHFNYIFGVNDDTHALFQIGMNKQEKREIKAAVAFTKSAFDAIKLAKDGGEVSEEKKAEIMENMHAIDDAQTGGLAEYTRRADSTEAKIN